MSGTTVDDFHHQLAAFLRQPHVHHTRPQACSAQGVFVRLSTTLRRSAAGQRSGALVTVVGSRPRSMRRWSASTIRPLMFARSTADRLRPLPWALHRP